MIVACSNNSDNSAIDVDTPKSSVVLDTSNDVVYLLNQGSPSSSCDSVTFLEKYGVVIVEGQFIDSVKSGDNVLSTFKVSKIVKSGSGYSITNDNTISVNNINAKTDSKVFVKDKTFRLYISLVAKKYYVLCGEEVIRTV